MPDLWCDVDAALAEVPVNIMPLIDDTDFKTIEASVAYNASGMALEWNFVTTAGAMSQTAVTPTTSGDYDWASQGNGMYSIEIPAAGGASINNDTEGFGWFTGVADGVLPWRGPTIGFRAAGLNNILIDSAYSATRGLAGTALPDAAAEAAGGLYTRGTGAGQIKQTNNGEIDSNSTHWNNLATVALPLVPTTAGRTLDVSTGGEAGLDWANIGSPTTAQNLSATNIDVDQIVASVSGAVGSVTGAVGSVTGNVGGNVTGSVGSVVADCGITQAGADKVFGASGAALAELSGVPSATPSPRNAMMLLFMSLRNKLTTDATTKTIYNTANTAIASKVLSDDSTTYTEAKMS